ncbi:MAG: GNAT family N-acetyltransferase [Mycobacteriales bacterium]
MTDVRVRVARVEDIPGLVASSAALFAEDAGTRDPTMNVEWPHQHGHLRFTETIGDPDRLILVADAAGEVVGHLTGALSEGTAYRPVTVATLASLYVRPTHRSGGVGADLVRAFRDWARDRGADRVAVTAYAANAAALRFYQREGFVPHTVTLETAP